MPAYYLIKSEPGSYSYADLQRDGRTQWDGVRNYQARNWLRGMQVGDMLLFYHSNAEPPHIAGIARVAATAVPDETQFDAADSHYDSKSTRENPRWWAPTVAPVAALPAPLPLAALRAEPLLADMWLLKPGSRLSITPVSPAEYTTILQMAGLPADLTTN